MEAENFITATGHASTAIIYIAEMVLKNDYGFCL